MFNISFNFDLFNNYYYFYERLILSVYESLNEIIKEKDMEKYNELVANLNDNYSSFYLWLAREDLEIGIKSFHFYIDQAISKIDKDKMDKELTSKVRELFKGSNQNMSDIETLRLNHGKTALYLATHLLNDSKVTNISNLESFKMKKLGTFSGTKLSKTPIFILLYLLLQSLFSFQKLNKTAPTYCFLL